MYFIFKRKDLIWCVAYHELDPDGAGAYVRETALCGTPKMAATICSWLNGGPAPEDYVGFIEWVGA